MVEQLKLTEADCNSLFVSSQTAMATFFFRYNPLGKFF